MAGRIQAADDFAAINARMVYLRYERTGCNARKGVPVTECWCMTASQEGKPVPCPAPAPAPAPDGWDYCC